MCCGWTFWFWFYQAFEFFFHSISFVQIFWFYPYICTVLYVPPPPPPYFFVQILCVILSSWNWGGEMLIDLTFSLCSFTPPPPRTYMGLFTFSHYSNPSVFRQYSSYIPFANSFSRTLCQYLYIFANIFVQYIITFCVVKFLSIFCEHYANVWTFLQTFSRSFHHCSMSGFYLPLPVYVNQ